MGEKDIVHTIFGKYSKYEIVKVSGWLGPKFYIRKSGKPHREAFSTLKAAVDVAEKEGQ
jgi:hypothetical protein